MNEKKMMVASEWLGNIIEDPAMLPGCYAILDGSTIEYHGRNGEWIRADAKMLEHLIELATKREDE